MSDIEIGMTIQDFIDTQNWIDQRRRAETQMTLGGLIRAGGELDLADDV